MVDENQAIVTEALNERRTLRNRDLEMTIASVDCRELRRQIAYKADWSGQIYVELDP